MSLSPDTAAMYRALCAQMGKEGLSGLGDVACWFSEKHEELQVLRGVTFFSIELRRSGDPTEAIKGVANECSTSCDSSPLATVTKRVPPPSRVCSRSERMTSRVR
jgi:hypothetical protein